MTLLSCVLVFFVFFFFNDTATTEIYTLSLHDALPISDDGRGHWPSPRAPACEGRSEEHTSELQSRLHLVCRLLLAKKKRKQISANPNTIYTYTAKFTSTSS